MNPSKTAGRPRNLTGLDAAEAIARVASGETRTSVAKRLGVSLQSVSTVCNSAGIEKGKRGRPRKDASVDEKVLTTNLVFELRSAGASKLGIAKRLGISRNVVRRICDKLGI